jgi:hypothetical protein
LKKACGKKVSADAVSAEHCYNENEDCGEAVAQQITVKYQTSSEDQETDEDVMTECGRVTDQEYREIYCWTMTLKAVKAVLYLHYT